MGQEKTLLTVLSVNGKSVIPRKMKNDRFIMTAIMCGVMFILLLMPAGKIPEKTATLVNYVTTRNSQVEFNDYNEIRNFSFRKGQYIEFNNQFSFPNIIYFEDGGFRYGSSSFISPASQKALPDLSPLYSHLKKLDALQETEEFVLLYLYTIDTADKYYYFINNFLPETYLYSISEFRDDFSENRYFKILDEAAEVFLNLPDDATEDDPIVYPAGGALKEYIQEVSGSDRNLDFLVQQISQTYSSFLREEVNLIDDLFNDVMADYMLEKDFFMINTGEYSDFGYDINSFEMEKFTSGGSFSTTALEREDMIPAYTVLEEFEQQVRDSFVELDTISGVITDVRVQENGSHYIRLDVDRVYDNIPNCAADLLLFLLLTAFLLYAAYFLVRENL